DTLYRLTDEYSLFYLKFIEGNKDVSADYWLNKSQGQEYKIWCGYAFENLCMKHVQYLKKALKISGIQSQVNSYLHRANNAYPKGFQIDLLIDRKDGMMNIFEMKFYADEFVINADYANSLRTKKEGLRTLSNGKKDISISFISTYSVFNNAHKLDLVDNDFTIDVLFEN
ncbi:MAG: ATP-binding protein, partial [Bacteroidetes bacterium]|nr:ATP-binding protein [Bacteroidota bacterium]